MIPKRQTKLSLTDIIGERLDKVENRTVREELGKHIWNLLSDLGYDTENGKVFQSNSIGSKTLAQLAVAPYRAIDVSPGVVVWASDATGGAKPAMSDGTDWKIISLGVTLT